MHSGRAKQNIVHIIKKYDCLIYARMLVDYICAHAKLLMLMLQPLAAYLLYSIACNMHVCVLSGEKNIYRVYIPIF
jgi:hypothetical protein